MSSTSNSPLGSNRVRIVVATSVMLTFISYWRAAAIILNDLGSSAFYACGIAEQAIGKSAPWFVLAVMLFAFAVRAVYVESCSMFVRGGVYRVVKEALGGTLAKLSVSALMFDYILTGPVSGVSAGQYIAGLINDTIAIADKHGWIPAALHHLFHGTPQFNGNTTAVLFAVAVTLYYWWENIKGIEESSEKALWVMQSHDRHGGAAAGLVFLHPAGRSAAICLPSRPSPTFTTVRNRSASGNTAACPTPSPFSDSSSASDTPSSP